MGSASDLPLLVRHEDIGRLLCERRVADGGIGRVYRARGDDGEEYAVKVGHRRARVGPRRATPYRRSTAGTGRGGAGPAIPDLPSGAPEEEEEEEEVPGAEVLDADAELVDRILEEEAARLFDVGPACGVETRGLGTWTDEQDGRERPALVTKWIEGVSLARMEVGAGRRDLWQAVAAVLARLAAAGEHRDLKPSNVLLTWTDDARLIDPGVSFPVEPGATDRVEVTTFPYYPAIPPGAARADLVALGIGLYERIAGVNPFVEDGCPAPAIYAGPRHGEGMPHPLEVLWDVPPLSAKVKVSRAEEAFVMGLIRRDEDREIAGWRRMALRLAR